MYGPTCFRPALDSIQVHVKTVDYKLIFKIFKVTTQQNIQAIKATKCSNGTNGEVNISHENTTMVVWIYDGI